MKTPRLINGTVIRAQATADVSLKHMDRTASTPKASRVSQQTGHTAPTRRVDVLETYYGRQWISTKGYDAATALREAYLNTQRGRGSDVTSERVDSTSDPTAAIATQLGRAGALVKISAHIAPGDEKIIVHVVCEGHAIASKRQIDKLRAALDRLADNMS